MIMKLFSNSAIGVMVVLQVVNVVQEKSNKPCCDLLKNKGKASTECGFFDGAHVYTNIGELSIVCDRENNFTSGKLWYV